MNSPEKTSELQGLSDFHRDYMRRYVECELRRQEKVSEAFLRERSVQLKSVKKAVRAS